MLTKQLITITTNNAFQNIGSPDFARLNDIGNLSVESPTIEQMNRAIGAAMPPRKEEDTAIFGTHIREAVAIVRDWVAHP